MIVQSVPEGDRLDPAAQANTGVAVYWTTRGGDRASTTGCHPMEAATKPSASRSARPRDLADLQIPQAAR